MQDLVSKLAQVIREGFVPIMVRDSFDPLFLCEIVQEAGFPAVEFTLRREDLEKIPVMRREFPELLLLIGSTIDQPEMVRFLRKKREFYSLPELCSLGADGLVSILSFRAETYRELSKQVILIPGVATLGEAIDQLTLGAHLVKFVSMPETAIKAFQAPTHHLLPIFYTGGATVERVEGYIEAGALVIGSGFDVILGEKYQEMQEKPDREYILDRLLTYRENVRRAREKTDEGRYCSLEDPLELLKGTGRYFPWIVD